MINIKTIKKYFIGITLAIFFNTSAFAKSITHVGCEINKFLAAVTDLAYIEYKTNTEYSNEDLQALIKSELNDLLSIMTTVDSLRFNNFDITTANLYRFFQDLVNVANNIRSRIKSDCIAGIYTNQNNKLDINKSIKTVGLSLRSVFKEILYYYSIDAECPEIPYTAFIRELTNTKLLYREKEKLFSALITTAGFLL